MIRLKQKITIFTIIVIIFCQYPVTITNAATNSTTIYKGVDYSAVYNKDYYLNRYSDLRAVYGNNATALIEHFVNHGMSEGRQASSNFNVASYIANYSDLRVIFGTTIKSYYQHYIQYGQYEGRTATGTNVIDFSAWYNGVDYSAVYNKEYYLNKYSDIKAVFGNNSSALIAHFVNYGMPEGRQASSNFNVASYITNYSDLRVTFGSQIKAYYLHYLQFGQYEGRTALGTNTIDFSAWYNGIDYSPVYNKDYYLNHNSDVKAVFGTNTKAVLQHFIQYGMAEGRAASSNFSVSYYKTTYPDLRAAFGNNLKSYYLHYITYGKNEGRLATSTGWNTIGSSKYYYENGRLSTGWKTINNRKYYFNSDGVLKSKTGIDVSQWQGTINWEKVKNDGIEFAIIRIGHGEYRDTKAIYNMMECERLGIPYGVYLYSEGTTQEKVDRELQIVLSMLEGMNPEMGVYVDMEDYVFYTITTSQVNELCVSFMDKIRNSGYIAGVYANKYWFTSILTSAQIDNYNKWVAEWRDTLTYEGKYMMWQYSSTTTVNGITENVVDMDVFIEQ